MNTYSNIEVKEITLNLPEKEIIDLYIDKKIDINKIAIIYRCSYGAIRNLLIRNKIKIRSISEAQKLCDKKLNLPIDQIIKEYQDGISTISLGKKYNCSDITISNRLKDNNIHVTRIIDLPDKEIIDLYINKEFSLRELAKIYNCSRDPIIKRLKNNNIKLRSLSESCIARQGLKLPDEKIIDLYINKKFSLLKLTKLYNCSQSTIRDLLLRNKIKIRSPSEAQNLRDKKLNLPEKKIIDLYTIEFKSIPNIANIYNCSDMPITVLLKKNNITIRTRKEINNMLCTKFCLNCGHEFIGKTVILYCPDCSPSEYCYKWDEDCREQNREKYNRECFFCGKSEEESGRKLNVHHINYDKDQGCNEKPDWKLIPLCSTCHGITGGSKENRELWEARILYLRKEYWSNINENK